jgi:RHS repeat-associated protein
MQYDDAGNMTSVTGTLYQNKTMVFNDESRLSSVAYGAVTDTYTYNWEGQRTRTRLNGVYHRYLYNGERVLQDLNDDGDWHTTYTTEDGSYEGTLVGIKRYNLDSERFPLYDEIGTARGLVCELGTVTDSYELDTFGTPSGPAQGTTPNPYRYGAAWGYITDPSGLLQLGARYYWPEVGRFVSQDPARAGIDWYTYVRNRPLREADPEGLYSPEAYSRWDKCFHAALQVFGRCLKSKLGGMSVVGQDTIACVVGCIGYLWWTGHGGWAACGVGCVVGAGVWTAISVVRAFWKCVGPFMKRMSQCNDALYLSPEE